MLTNEYGHVINKTSEQTQEKNQENLLTNSWILFKNYILF